MTEEQTAEQWVHSLPDKFLACRRFGHPWRHHDVDEVSAKPMLVEVLRCPSCGKKRLDTVNAHGHVVARSYVDVPGYLAQGIEGLGRGNRDPFRLEALTRIQERRKQKAPVKRAPKRRLKAVS